MGLHEVLRRYSLQISGSSASKWIWHCSSISAQESPKSLSWFPMSPPSMTESSIQGSSTWVNDLLFFWPAIKRGVIHNPHGTEFQVVNPKQTLTVSYNWLNTPALEKKVKLKTHLFVYGFLLHCAKPKEAAITLWSVLTVLAPVRRCLAFVKHWVVCFDTSFAAIHHSKFSC